MSKFSTLIEQVKKNEHNIIQKIEVQQLAPLLEYADHVYHEEGSTPIFSDHLYDILRNRLEQLDPQNSFFSKVGSEAGKQNKVKLPFWLGSMDKFKADTTQIPRWVSKHPGPYLVSEKLDGISLLILFNDKGTVQIFTRGNGSQGRDVSYIQAIFNFKKVVSGLKKMKITQVAVRGEMIVSKENFKKYDEFQKSRNMISGIVNRKEEQDLTPFIGKVDFVAFELLKPRVKISQQYQLLEQLGLKTALHEQVSKIDKHILSELLPRFRKDSHYEIDGIIITDDHEYPVNREKNPKYAFAFKMINNDEVAETRVIDVEWNASKDGYLMPKVIIEQVILSGSKVNRTSGKNAKFIKEHKIGIGSVVKVTLDGGVVPGILEVIESSDEGKMPSELSSGLCVWDATQTNLILVNVSGNNDIKIKQLVYFFKHIKTDNLDVGILTKLVEYGYDSVAKLLKMTKSDLLAIEGFKEKLADKIIGNIKTSFQKATLLELMDASNKFGRGLGIKKLSVILKEYPDIIHQHYSSEQLSEMVLKLDGFSDKTTMLFVKSVPVFKEFMTEIGANLQTYQVKTTKKKASSESLALEGHKIVLTGFRDANITSFIEDQGGEVTNSVSKNTSMVICKDVNDSSGKITKAKSLGVSVVSVDQFREQYLS